MDRYEILLTGAAGRIGRTLAEGLSMEGKRLRLTDVVAFGEAPAGATFVREDLRDPAAAERLCAGADVLFHLAGHPSSTDWDVIQSLNIDPTRRLFEAAARAGVTRIVFASSVHVAGYAPADAQMTSAMPYQPDGPYGLSKVFGETALRYLCDLHGTVGIALRICSFRPEPTNARELRTWLSPGDMVRLANAAVEAPVNGYLNVWGISANARASIDRSPWTQIGYEPRDDASSFVDQLATAGVDVEAVSEWEFLGGAFALPPRPRS